MNPSFASHRKFVPSKTNPLLAKILAMSVSTSATSISSSAPSSTGSPTPSALTKSYDQRQDAPRTHPDDDISNREVTSTSSTAVTLARSEDNTPSLNGNSGPKSRKRKAAPSRAIIESESDDPLGLSSAPKRKKAYTNASSAEPKTKSASILINSETQKPARNVLDDAPLPVLAERQAASIVPSKAKKPTNYSTKGVALKRASRVTEEYPESHSAAEGSTLTAFLALELAN